MKILQIVKTSEGANWAFEQAKKLYEYGIEIITILPDDKGKVAKKYLENNMKIRIADFSLPISKPWKFFKRKKIIRSIIDEEKPDLIHIHFVTNVIMCRLSLKKSKIPRLFQIPGPLHLESIFFKKLDLYTANEYDYWAPSCKKSNQIYIDEGITDDRVFIAYYGGYGGNSVKEYYDSTNLLHKQYNIPQNNITIGMVSYFYKPKWYLGQKRGIKGHEDFIDAIEIINRKYSNISAFIIGGPWGKSYKYQDKVKKYAQNKHINNIFFTGFRNDMKKIYKELDIAVHPSHSENLGGAAESLAAGVPTIATNIGGFPDIVIDGKTGYLCNSKDPVSLAEKIEMMINNKTKAAEMATCGQELVYNLLNIDNTSERILEIYKKILEKRI